MKRQPYYHTPGTCYETGYHRHQPRKTWTMRQETSKINHALRPARLRLCKTRVTHRVLATDVPLGIPGPPCNDARHMGHQPRKTWTMRQDTIEINHALRLAGPCLCNDSCNPPSISSRPPARQTRASGHDPSMTYCNHATAVT